MSEGAPQRTSRIRVVLEVDVPTQHARGWTPGLQRLTADLARTAQGYDDGQWQLYSASAYDSRGLGTLARWTRTNGWMQVTVETGEVL